MPKKTTSHIFHFTNQLGENGMNQSFFVDMALLNKLQIKVKHWNQVASWLRLGGDYASSENKNILDSYYQMVGNCISLAHYIIFQNCHGASLFYKNVFALIVT
jgi:hypothetical protein